MTQEPDFLHWYETNLPARERKIRGHYSTPTRLIEQILDVCGYTADQDLSRLRVLDPACGSGNFLTGAVRRLMASEEQFKRSPGMLVKHIQHNIWGFDPDPIACFLAEMQIRSTFSAHYPHIKTLRNLHIHQADGLAFPWEQSSNHQAVDLFLANPPYLAAKNNDLSGYRSAHQRGQSDSYLFFLDLALQIVRPGGWICLVVPDPVLARINATQERKRLLAETTIHHLWHLANVFTAYVGAVVIIARKGAPSKHHLIQWRRERWHPRNMNALTTPTPILNTQPQHVEQSLLRRQPNAELRYLLSNQKNKLLEQLSLYTHDFKQDFSATANRLTSPHPLQPLRQLVTIRRGEELGKDSPYLHTHSSAHHNAYYHPVLRGGIDVRPYSSLQASRYIAREHISKPLERYLTPKLLLVKSVGRLQATLDTQGHVVLQTLYMLHLTQPPTEQASFTQEDELYFLLALLNSRLLQEYVYVLYTAYKWVQPQIEQHVLANLPIPVDIDPTAKRAIIERARQLMQACAQTTPALKLKEQIKQSLYEEQEQAIHALYVMALIKQQHREIS
ncbi:MAG TPA: N-6 DNA methylase [Dictyobacter sp.]|jgi:hypothetical protein|nr:N-6 DNA methylase [Dictyobacter sp.]